MVLSRLGTFGVGSTDVEPRLAFGDTSLTRSPQYALRVLPSYFVEVSTEGEMASVRLTVRVFAVSILLASLVLMGSGVMASGAASASPSSCYPPGSTSCTGKLTAIPSTVVRLWIFRAR